jgi:hypothetical protein
MVTSHQIRLAIEEFNRLEREGVEHGRILVAQRVPKSKIRSSFWPVVIEADYEDINVTKKTRADYTFQNFPVLRMTADLPVLN